jgi:hypothetical protein
MSHGLRARPWTRRFFWEIHPMASDEPLVASDSDWPITNPWPFLVFALAAVTISFLLLRVASARTDWPTEEEQKQAEYIPEALEYRSAPHEWPVPRAIILAIGLLAAGLAVSIRPSSAFVVAGAAVVGVIAIFAASDWDSAQLALKVATGVAAVAAILLVLPGTVSRVLVSVLIVIHFGGMFTAATSVTPPQGTTPWLPQQIWTRIYRPYLQFTYMNNAYHFYSPNPGPATLLWCRIEYADKSSRWVKLPNRDEHFTDPLGQEYYRRLSLTEGVNQTQPTPAVPEPIRVRRVLAGEEFVNKGGAQIPLHPYYPVADQLARPQVMTHRMLCSYARHLAHSYPHPTDPSKPVVGVKIYRIRHMMIEPYDVVTDKGGRIRRSDPNRKDLFHPYYQGEYDTNGNLKDPNDPFLYWWIPIIPVYENEQTVKQGKFVLQLAPDVDAQIINYRDCFKLHAGSDPWGGEQ